MPHDAHIKIQGRIGDVFLHRFVLELVSGHKILADIGPHGLAAFPLEKGTEIVVEGEMKPSELKVSSIARKGETPVEIGHKKHGPGAHAHPHDDAADPAKAKAALVAAGVTPLGAPRRKPKHFEILGRKGTDVCEYHVELDGHIRKQKAIAPDDHKWSAELARVA